MAFSDAGRIGFVIKGDYDATATYEFLDVVYSNNATYIARKVTTGDPVTDTTAWFCALNADLNGMVHSATINPSASAPFAADWLMENGAVITPQSNDLYRVLVEGKERLYFWNGTSYEILSGGGHTIEKVNPTSGAITPMDQQDNLLFTGVNVTNDNVNKRTTIHGQLKVCATKAEWDALSQAEKDDPNTYWVRPWADTVAFATDKTPVGAVLSVATGKTGDGISGITTPTGTFPTADYLVCNGQSVSVATYPALATYFQTRYGSTYYFGGSGASFSLPNWSSDFPSNGVLVMKARESSNAMSITEIDDTSVSEDKTWSSEKIDSEITLLSNINRRTRKNITSNLANLSAAVAEQNLAKYGYSIGDYFVGASGQYYILADMDCNYGGYNSYAVVGTHHIGIIVDSKQTSAWLSSGSVSSYSASTLHSFLSGTVLTNVKSDFKVLFGGSTGAEHLLARTELDNAIGGWGTTWTGLANCLICAMTEVQIYGSTVFSADGFQTGTGSKQLEVFKKFRFNEIYGNVSIWLKSLLSASEACYATNAGLASFAGVAHANRASGLILFY